MADSAANNRPSSPCLCFPCIIHYLDGYVPANSETQVYPQLARKGFSQADQQAIAEEWYWVQVERETAIKDYLAGNKTFRDGCWWRTPPLQPSMQTPASTSTSPSSSISGPSA